jgi:hypothetical protein
MNERRCPDCDAAWGELHEGFCIKERCPFCGGQLVLCDCIFTVLNLTDAERVAVEEYIDDSVEPLRDICKRWAAALGAKGRVPFGKSPSG